MTSADKSHEAVLSSAEGFTAFSFGGYHIRFRAPYSLERYVKVVSWDNVHITVYDPWANPEVVKREYGIDIVSDLPAEKFDTAIVAVAHKQFRQQEVDITALLNDSHVIYDVKGILPREIIDGRL